MAWFLKFKFQSILKLNFNGGQFYKKIKILVITKIVNFPTTLKNEQWKSDDQENKIKTTLTINDLFYLHNNWHVKVKCQKIRQKWSDL